MSGVPLGPYWEKGEGEIQGSFNRHSTNDFFTGSELRNDLIAADAEPKEGAGSLNFQGAYALTRDINLTADVPITLYSYWNYPLGGTRYEMKTHGFGDTVLGGRVWLRNTEKSPNQNAALQLALRLPTGDSNYQVLCPNGLTLRTVPRKSTYSRVAGHWDSGRQHKVSAGSGISLRTETPYTFSV
jgi:hypothetical protein